MAYATRRAPAISLAVPVCYNGIINEAFLSNIQNLTSNIVYGEKTMQKEIISTNGAPAAIGPYSQAVRVGNLLFLSGQIPLDPETGAVVGQNAAEQCRRVLENLRAVLEAGGSSLKNVVKTTIFLVDLSWFQAVNEVYAEFFDQESPARSTVQVSALPRGARVEIEAIAVIDE
jgi:2-iminobutanoate/2-iminopropanoate deaminase